VAEPLVGEAAGVVAVGPAPLPADGVLGDAGGVLGDVDGDVLVVGAAEGDVRPGTVNAASVTMPSAFVVRTTGSAAPRR
jgi:hypothetical protein